MFLLQHNNVKAFYWLIIIKRESGKLWQNSSEKSIICVQLLIKNLMYKRQKYLYCYSSSLFLFVFFTAVLIENSIPSPKRKREASIAVVYVMKWNIFYGKRDISSLLSYKIWVEIRIFYKKEIIQCFFNLKEKQLIFKHFV